MLAWGALANPWLFPESLRALELPIPGGFLDPSPGLRGAELSCLGERARALCGERLAVVLLKRLMERIVFINTIGVIGQDLNLFQLPDQPRTAFQPVAQAVHRCRVVCPPRYHHMA